MGCFFIWGSGGEDVIIRMKGGSFSAKISADPSNRTGFKYTLRLLSTAIKSGLSGRLVAFGIRRVAIGSRETSIRSQQAIMTHYWTCFS